MDMGHIPTSTKRGHMKLDAKALIDAVRARAASEPERIYTYPTVGLTEDGEDIVAEECVYVYRTYDDAYELKPSCLIGYGLIDIGVPAEKLEKIDVMQILALDRKFGFGLPTGALRWLSIVQDGQDFLKPWGVAVRDADSQCLNEGVIV